MSEEQPASETNRPAQPREPAGSRRRGRRGGRGRGGPRRPAPMAPVSPVSPADQPPAGTPFESTPAPESRPPVAAPVRADGSAVSQAVNEVMGIVESLKLALAQMEDVLELVEHAERQKLADEHEIDSLRRLLRQLQHPRSGRGDSGRGERREHDSRGARDSREGHQVREDRDVRTDSPEPG